MSKQTLLQRISNLIHENELKKSAYFSKIAAQPPMGMDPSMMGGMPPMDPSMMMGGGGMPPMDPAMMGGAPPMDPAAAGMPPVAPPPPAESAPPADPAAAAAASDPAAPVKKLKPDEYMAKLDTRLYNLQVQVAALMKKLGVEVPPEALIVPTSDQEQNLDNPVPQLPDLGNSGGAPAELPPEAGMEAGASPDMMMPPDAGGDTPKTASYKKSYGYDPEAVAKLIYGLKKLY